MRKQVTKSFKVDAEAWVNFVRSAEFYGATPAELLRELVGHVDAAMKGIKSGRIQSFNGDVPRLIGTEFPQLSPFHLRRMAEVLMEAARLSEEERGK
jgi:hypothetical protein